MWMVEGAKFVYVDENSINRTVASLILQEGGAFCVAVSTMRAMIDAIGGGSFDAAIVDLQTAAADPEGFDIAKRDPRFRDLPFLAVGADRAQATAIGAAFFVPAPLDPTLFLETASDALSSRSPAAATNGKSAIVRTALLSRVSGNRSAAADVLSQFVHDYAGYAALIQEASKRNDAEKAEFLLRNLRAAASAVGAEALYRLAAQVQEDAQRGTGMPMDALAVALKEAVDGAGALREDLLAHGGREMASRARQQKCADSDERAKERGGIARIGAAEETGEKPTVLVVDDSPANLRFLETSLQHEYAIATASDGEQGLREARGPRRPDLILLDVTMPGIDGYETCRLLKEDPRTRSIPVVFLTSLSKEADEERGLALGAVDYIRKPFSVPVLKARIRSHLDLLRYREYLETLVDERTRELKETQLEVIYRLARAAEYRDNDTGSHIKRIGYYAMTIAERLGFPRAEADLLYYASAMHDVGKIGIPDNILLKPGKLTAEEWETMKAHPTIGAGLLEGHPSQLLRVATRVALTHHEKWDGSGYPSNLRGEGIPMEGRVVAVCDVFDALLSSRPYKREWSPEETLDEINRLSGAHFDPAVVRAFNAVYPELLLIKSRLKD